MIWIIAAFLAVLIGGWGARVIYRIRREERRRRARVVEKPNSYYTPKLVKDREDRERWQRIPLEAVHEVNRPEVKRLLDKIEALGVDGLTPPERTFLNQLVVITPPVPRGNRVRSSGGEDPGWPPYPPLSPVGPGGTASRS